jgi:hypothetical protein
MSEAWPPLQEWGNRSRNEQRPRHSAEDDQAFLDTHGLTWREYVNEAYSTPVNQRMSQWDYQGRQ